MIEPAPVHAGDVLDWLHAQGKRRAEAVPGLDVEKTLQQVRSEAERSATEQRQGKPDAGSRFGQDGNDAVIRLKTLHRLSGPDHARQAQRESFAGGDAVREVAAEAAWKAPISQFAPRSIGSTVQRLVLGGHLRRLRERCGLTAEQAAEAIRGSRSKISRMERGRVRFKERDIADLLTLYGVTGEEEQAVLALEREANTPSKEEGILPYWVGTYLALEAAASFIHTYEVQFVPGLLQTEGYARALIRLGNAGNEEEIARRAEARMRRQQIFDREAPPRMWAVIDEAALRRPIGGPAVMREQICHLIDMAEHPAVTLQVLPFLAGARARTGGPFTVLRFAEPDLQDVVYVEQLTSAIYLDNPTEVDGYLEVMEQLCLRAWSPAKTLEALENFGTSKDSGAT
jgi:transcriptional regulator with XRE-family HTH domain